MQCSHGCGREAIKQTKYTKTWICEEIANKCPAVRAKNSQGLSKAHKEGRANHNFGGNQGWAKNKTKLNIDKVFVENSTYSTARVKAIILREQIIDYKCECGISNEWQGKLITLELDHIDGNNRNNLITNLRFLCPNCHSQTSTYKGKNISRKKISDDQILELIQQGLNNRQVLIQLNLTPKGGNYVRLNKLRDIMQVPGA